MNEMILRDQMLQMFLMIACGVGLNKARIMTKDFQQDLTRFLVDFSMPVLILSSVLNQTGEREYKNVGIVFVCSLCWTVLMPVVGGLAARILRVQKGGRGLYAFMMTFSNIGFMGFPLIDALFGKEAVLYTAVYNLVFTLAVYSIGTRLILGEENRTEGADLQQLKKSLWTPGFVGAVAAILLYFLPVEFPKLICHTADTLGSVTSPLAMLMIGATLAKMQIKEILTDVRIYLFAGIKQFIIPLAAYPVFRMVIADEYIRGVLFILILMPVANTAVLFSNRYGGDEELAAKGIFATTVISIVSIPCCLYLVGI